MLRSNDLKVRILFELLCLVLVGPLAIWNTYLFAKVVMGAEREPYWMIIIIGFASFFVFFQFYRIFSAFHNEVFCFRKMMRVIIDAEQRERVVIIIPRPDGFVPLIASREASLQVITEVTRYIDSEE